MLLGGGGGDSIQSPVEITPFPITNSFFHTFVLKLCSNTSHALQIL